MLNFYALSLDLVRQFRHQISKLRELGNGLSACHTKTSGWFSIALQPT